MDHHTVSDLLRVLVTEASSPTAYHLLPMLASGDVIHGRVIELVLCDCREVNEDMEGVAMELKDCAFPLLSSVSLTSDFCEASKTADVIIMLPNQNIDDAGVHGNKEVDISYNSLNHVDFSSLDTVMHRSVISKMRSATVQCKGPLSSACAIADSLKQIHEESLKEVEREMQIRHEEAEFGCPPASIEDITFTHNGGHFFDMTYGTKTLVIFVSASDINDSAIIDESSSEDTAIFTRIYARL